MITLFNLTLHWKLFAPRELLDPAPTKEGSPFQASLLYRRKNLRGGGGGGGGREKHDKKRERI